MSSSGNSRRKFKSSPTRQSDLSEFGAVSYCSLPRQARLDQYFPKNNPILDILLACMKESEVLDKAADKETKSNEGWGKYRRFRRFTKRRYLK